MLFPSQYDVSKAWSDIKWMTGELSHSEDNKAYPIVAPRFPRTPGIYKIIWSDSISWKKLRTSIEVEASPSIDDPTLDFSEVDAPVCLTIGKSINLYNRIRQHFGFNDNNNRAFRRLRSVAPSEINDEELREMIIKSVSVLYIEVSNWIYRDLFEGYAKSVTVPLFDLRAER